MKSRERALRAICFKETDRIPVDFSCTEEFQEKFCNHYNIKRREIINNPLFSPADPQILEMVNCDFRSVSPCYIGPEIKSRDDGSFVNLFGVLEKPVYFNGATYYEYKGTPLKDAAIDDVENYLWPHPEWFDYSSVRKQCEEFKDFAVIAGYPGNVDFFHKICSLYGFENMFKGLVKKDPLLLRIFEKISDFFYEYNRRIFEAGKGMIDIAFYGDDYGGQFGPLIGERVFVDVLEPFWKRHFTLAGSYGLKIMFHSCGSVFNLLPLLCSAGVDIMDPLQSDAHNMDVEMVKERFAWRMAFHGAIDFQKNYGNVEDLLLEVKRVTSVMALGGGYILAPTSIVTPDVPIEYIEAVYMNSRK